MAMTTRTMKVISLFCLLFLSTKSLALNQHEYVRSRSDSQMNVDSDQSDGTQSRRKLVSLWNGVLFALAASKECPPGPLGKKCRDTKSSSGGSSSGGSSSSSSGSSASASSSSSTSYSETGGNNGGSTRSSIPDPTAASFMWMYIVAAVATMFAIGAIIAGQRKPAKSTHPLSGSVQKRIGLFSQFADSTLCASMARPERVVEMTMSSDDGALA